MHLKEEKITQIRNRVDMILEDLEISSTKGTKLHEVERSILNSLLQLGLEMLRYYIFLVTQLVSQAEPIDKEGKKLQNKGERLREYISVFGRLKIVRRKYYSESQKTQYKLDAALGLPAGRYSYLLEDWLAFGAVEMDFQQSVSYIERILGHRLHGMQSGRCTYHLSEQVDSYYEEKAWPEKEQATHWSLGYDGKGVPIRRSEAARCQESTSIRLSKGKNRDIKREATVSVSSSFTARKRSVEQIIESLFSPEPKQDRVSPHREGQGEKHCWHADKHIRAFLSDKKQAINYGIENILKREAAPREAAPREATANKTSVATPGVATPGQKPIVVLIDGDRALEKAVKKAAENKQISHRISAYVLDFIHLLEYVWKVASVETPNAYLGEKNAQREDWVRQQAILLLNSQWQEALEQWQKILTDEKLTATQAYNVKRAITYVGKRPHMIDYKTYLEKGYPITTGVVESACGHFVKSRMERNAMHWSKKGAQKMLNIRAIKKNDDWNNYLESFVDKEQVNLYKNAA